MATLVVQRRGRVGLAPVMLDPLGVKPGDPLEMRLLPGGRVQLCGVRAVGSIEAFLGRLARRSSKVATLDEINEAASEGWSGKSFT